MIPPEISKVIEHFKLSDSPVSVSRWGEGHIHETYLVETGNHKPDYILQKLNHFVFRNIPGMMENIEAVTRHIRSKLTGFQGHNPDIESLTLVYTKNDQSFYLDENEVYWRMYVFIPDTFSLQKITELPQAFEAGKAIGFFQAMLADLDTRLVDTIPDFHNIDFRISQYEQAKSTDPAGRIARVPEDIRFVEQRFGQMKSYYASLKEKAVVRATHNDTKVNNVLFDRNNKAQCLIDLDTVMPGYVHFDYGDALRTIANTALEDERDLGKVHFNEDVYQAFTKGYLKEAGSFLNQHELELLLYAPIFLTFIIGLRFLTDYLNGDVYYRIHHPDHNLERARVQFKLVEEMERALNFN
ncbi:MAG: aminoglycoside phosphotransferase family protein [Bacteroidales bacterium]